MAMIMTPFAHLFGSKFSFQNRNGIAKYALVWKHDSHSSIGIFAIPCPFWNDQTNITLVSLSQQCRSCHDCITRVLQTCDCVTIENTTHRTVSHAQFCAPSGKRQDMWLLQVWQCSWLDNCSANDLTPNAKHMRNTHT